MKKISHFASFLALAAPSLAAAAAQPNPAAIKPYSDAIIYVINYILVPVLLAIAFIVFLWGAYKYFILGAADEKSRTDGRQFVLWGVIGFVVIFSVWGLVAIITGTLGLTTGSNPTPPTFNTSPGTSNAPQSAPTNSFNGISI